MFGKKFLIIVVFILLLAGGFFYFRSQVYYSHGNFYGEKIFKIEKGEGNTEIAANLKNEGFISGRIYFYYYLRKENLLNRIIPGEYQLSGNLSIPEIAHIITNPEEKFIKITFPEGFTAKQMAERLKDKNLPGNEFLEIANNPGEFKKRYSYLSVPEVKTLEGYLFPDTYFFKPEISAENIIGRLLDNFDGKLDSKLRGEIENQKKNIKDIVIMASIVEKEAQTAKDMELVSGIFWKRLSIGKRLESDAPLSYILDDNIDSHGAKDLEFDSPYNTYRNIGLPPGPISNPGMNAIGAAIYPQNSNYIFFLTATINGEKQVFYAATYEEHLANKRKAGL